jgi:hypothetical protein
MIAVIALPPGDQWDQHLLDLLLSNRLYPTGLEFTRAERVPWPDTDGLVLIIPGRYWHARADIGIINKICARYQWILAIRTGDEEDLFDITAIDHPNIAWWIQTPKVGKDYGDAQLLPLGFGPHFSEMDTEVPDKALDVFLSAQNTHQRREECFAACTIALALLPDAATIIGETDGFTRGLPPQVYARSMVAAKVAPAPSGAVSPDSFRLWEALEAHAVPIADDMSPTYDSTGYWALMCPQAPFPVLVDHIDLPGYIEAELAAWPRNANRVTAWWINYKRALAHRLRADLDRLAPCERTDPLITVILTASPIRSHPDTRILDETIGSIRAQLPGAEIILTFDGVRSEQEALRGAYEEHIRRVLWKADHQWRHVLPLIFDEHVHQAVATKRALERVRTPLILFVEQDTPLNERDIPWADIGETILAGDANVVRFSHEASILEPHRHLMLDPAPQLVRGVPMTRTIQWSQRPHLASRAFYRSMLERYFPNDERSFIEDVIYGKLSVTHAIDGDMGWLGWRTWLFTPEGSIERSYHTDGREGASKFDT